MLGPIILGGLLLDIPKKKEWIEYRLVAVKIMIEIPPIRTNESDEFEDPVITLQN